MPPTSQNTTATLLQLLPTFAPTTLPPPLIDLTSSLYARSRARAPVLKREEEIAREYACAVLAVNRLKTRLNLPDVDVRAPCPPKVFNKLLRFLDGTLPKSQTSTQIATPTKRAGKAAPGDLDGTPLKTPRSAAASTPDGRKRRRLDVPQGSGIILEPETREGLKEIAQWLPEYICGVRNNVQAPSPLFERGVAAGVLVIVKSKNPAHWIPQLNRASVAGPDHVAVLVVAVSLFVLESLLYDFDARSAASKAVQELMARRVVTAVHFGNTVSKARGLLEDRAETWRTMGWFRDLQRDSALPRDHADDELAQDGDLDELAEEPMADGEDGVGAEIGPDQEQEDADDESPPKTAPATERLLPRTGLGTMLQPKTDWLSLERRQNYVEWKAQMMRKIAQMEKKGLVVDA